MVMWVPRSVRQHQEEMALRLSEIAAAAIRALIPE